MDNKLTTPPRSPAGSALVYNAFDDLEDDADGLNMILNRIREGGEDLDKKYTPQASLYYTRPS